MIEEEDLWIGDKVRLKKSGRIGKYEGKNQQGKLKVSLGFKTVLTSAANLEVIAYESPKTNPIIDDSIQETISFDSKVLDLHMEILNPKMANALPERIIAYQISKAKDFLQFSINKGWITCVIIHGRGEGVLRSEIHHLLSMTDKVKHYNLINNNGATEVWFG